MLGPYAEFSVTDGLRPSDPNDFSEATVAECLDLLQCSSHVSALDSSTVVVKILILMLMVKLGEVQMFFMSRKAALDLPILTTSSDRIRLQNAPYSLGTLLYSTILKNSELSRQLSVFVFILSAPCDL